MKTIKLLAVVIVITLLSIATNIALIYLCPDTEYSLWVSAQSLILTFIAATYCVKTKINHFLEREIDLIGVFSVAVAISASITSFYVNDKFKLPDTLIYSLVIILGIAFIIWDYKTFKNKTTRYMANIKSTSTFRETNSQIVITTRIDKAP
ncbi:hypothetical protein QDQ61_15390 [Citrobacter freundii]|uniref:Uncharacterized protein n=4 Tax=Citrobacter freundii TaxID=546 RepID=A0AAP5XTL9_CITFR|nr:MULTISPECIES: hypothetical protein [Citrobacter]AYL55900.1 hypothetical protein CUC48_04480 [Citrobacter freundii]EJC6093781.1 hypothetical protein [Citrobacter freundii]EKX9626626.1 hypothetical protein [Citrobacter freundii]ELA7615579.1 hypothetical protein [Citrobacter freundii]ELK1250622.1 hypothetical protein [Citrobacter freundii]